MGSRIGSRGLLLDDVLWVDLIEIAAGHLTRLALPARLAAGRARRDAAQHAEAEAVAADRRFRCAPARLRLAASVERARRRAQRAHRGRDRRRAGHAGRTQHGRRRRSRWRSAVSAPNASRASCSSARRITAPSRRCSRCAASIRRCASSRPSTGGTRAEDLARIVFRTLPSLHELLPDAATRPAGRTCSTRRPGPTTHCDPTRSCCWPRGSERERWPGSDARCLHDRGRAPGHRHVAVVDRREFDFGLTPRATAPCRCALAVRPGERAWYVGEKHGGLPNNGRVIAAVVDLLRTGTTQRLPAAASRAARAGVRQVSEATLRRVAPHKVQLAAPVARRATPAARAGRVAGVPRCGAARARSSARSAAARPRARRGPERTLEIRLVRGSITEANARALVLGVFRNVDPSGPAAAVDAATRRRHSRVHAAAHVRGATRPGLRCCRSRAAGCSRSSCCSRASATSTTSAPMPRSFVAENIVRTFARTQRRGLRDRAVRRGIGRAGGDGARAAAARIRRRRAARGPGRGRASHHDLRNRPAQVRGAACARPGDVAARAQDTDLALVIDEVDATRNARHGRSPLARRPRSRSAAPGDPAYLLVSMTAAGTQHTTNAARRC